jgi:hypothetical protein
MFCSFQKAHEYNYKKDHYCFNIDMTEALDIGLEIKTWCNDNIKGELDVLDGKDYASERIVPMIFIIFDKDDAMLFKLRWM